MHGSAATAQVAVVSKHHGVPFYVAAPVTSIDLDIDSVSQAMILLISVVFKYD